MSSSLGVAVVERDIAGDDMVTWKYPALDEDVERVVLDEATEAADDAEGLFVSKLGHRWIYSCVPATREVSPPNVSDG